MVLDIDFWEIIPKAKQYKSNKIQRKHGKITQMALKIIIQHDRTAHKQMIGISERQLGPNWL